MNREIVLKSYLENAEILKKRNTENIKLPLKMRRAQKQWKWILTKTAKKSLYNFCSYA